MWSRLKDSGKKRFCALRSETGTNACFSSTPRVHMYSCMIIVCWSYAGKVTTKELGSLLRSLGRTPTNAEVAEMIKEAPADGKIDFDTFLGFLARKGQVRDF